MAKAKQDFAGKAKTSKTYDKDWVFSQKSRAWITKAQAKGEHADQVAKHRAAVAAQNAVAGPVPTSLAPINVGGVLSTDQYAKNIPSAPPSGATGTTTPLPSWWIGQAYTNPTPEQSFANAANAMLPMLSPEDQRYLGNYLATNFGDVFGGYQNAAYAPIPTSMTDELRNQYLSPGRAQTALTLLDRMQQASGSAEMGPGYNFLKTALNLINQYSGQGPMTREQYDQFSQAVNALVGGANTDQKAYANLAQLFNLPTFSAGPIVSNAPNNKLYA